MVCVSVGLQVIFPWFSKYCFIVLIKKVCSLFLHYKQSEIEDQGTKKSICPSFLTSCFGCRMSDGDFLKPVIHFFHFNLIPFISCLSPDFDNVRALKTSARTSHTILAHTPSTTCWSYQNSKKKIITNLSSRTHFSSTKTNLFCSYISLLYKVHSTAVFLFTSLPIFYTHFYQNLEKTAKKPEKLSY